MLSWDKLVDTHRTDGLFADHSDEQVEAVIRVLAHTVYADERASFMEEVELEHMLQQLPWGDEKQDLIKEVTRAVAETPRGERQEAFQLVARGAAERLDQLSRVTVFKMAVTLAWAEGEVHAAERTALTSLAEAFEIFPEQAAQLLAEGHPDAE